MKGVVQVFGSRKTAVRGSARFTRAIAALAAVLLLCAMIAPAVALAGARVTFRAEAPSSTVWKGSLWVSNAHDIVDKDGAHHETTVTALGALDDAARIGAFPYVMADSPWGLSLESINGLSFDPNPPWPGWLCRVNGAMPKIDGTFVGIDSFPVKTSDDVLFYYGVSSFGAAGPETSPTAVRLSSSLVNVDTTLTATALQLDVDGNATPLPDARVYIGSSTATSNASGIVQMKMTRLGTYGVRVEKSGDYVRSATKSARVVRRSAIRFSATLVRRGRAVFARLAGRLVSGGVGLAARRVRIQLRRSPTAPWRNAQVVITGRLGYFGTRAPAWRPKTWYRAVWSGDSTHRGAASPVRSVP